MRSRKKISTKRYIGILLFFSMILINLASCAPKSIEKKEVSSKIEVRKEKESVQSEVVIKEKMEKRTKKEAKKLKIPKNELVWRILDTKPEWEDEEWTVKEISVRFEEGLNRLLKKKGAKYQVRIEPFAYGDKTYKRMETKNDISDLISATRLSGRKDINAYSHFVKKGFLRSLDYLLASKRGKKIKESILKENLELAKIGGSIYGLSTVLLPVDAMAYDVQVLKDCGIAASEIKGNFFENDKLLRKLKEKTKKSVLTMRQTVIPSEMNMWILSPSEVVGFGKAGRFVNIIDTKRFKERMKKLFAMKKEGLISIGNIHPKDSVFNPGELYFSGKRQMKELKIVHGKENFKKNVIIVPNTGSIIRQIYWGDYKTGITPWTKKREWAEDFLERLFTDPDIANMIRYGEEGVKLRVGKRRGLETSEKNAWLREISGLFTNAMITFPEKYEEKDKKEYMREIFESFPKKFPFGFRFEPAAVMNEIEACNRVMEDRWDMGNAPNTTLQRISALEVTDMDKEIDTLLTELKEAGVDKIIEEANRQLEKWKKENGK